MDTLTLPRPEPHRALLHRGPCEAARALRLQRAHQVIHAARSLALATLAAGVATFGMRAHASEVGHFAPGVLNIRDFVVPEPGVYGVLYNYGYRAVRLNDRNGDELDSVTIDPGPGAGVTLGLDVDVDVYVLAPAFIWVSDWKVLGARYAAYVVPTFGNTSVGASLATQLGSGRSVEESQFNVGDLFVQPLWLGSAQKHWDLAIGYGFYAPVGKYDTETVTLPGGSTITAEAVDNIGLGFWTHQLQGAASWYPWEDKRLAVATALTYEINDEKDDFDLTPGQVLTLNWGLSQYLPLREDQKLLLEVGAAGYDSWQITEDGGSDPRITGALDRVHAAGGQLGLTYVPWNAALNVRYLYEFASEDRFQGQSVGVNLAIGAKLRPGTRG